MYQTRNVVGIIYDPMNQQFDARKDIKI